MRTRNLFLINPPMAITIFLYHINPSVLQSLTAMEDWNTLAADCLVLSCCCQCIILQILIFILLKLPAKLARKTKEFAKKRLKLGCRKKTNKGIESLKVDELGEFIEGCLTVRVEEFDSSHGHGNCMQHVESILEELSQKGEFSFGSFWGRGSSSAICALVTKQDIDFSAVQFEFVDIVHSFDFSD